MLEKISRFFYSVPTPLSGLALGIASLGLGLENSLPLHSTGQITGALVSMSLVCMVLIKFLLNPQLLKEELQHPVLSSIMPTTAMAMMLQSKSLGLFYPVYAEILWVFAICLHLVLLSIFIIFRSKSFCLYDMVPSWFVPFIGISVAAITVPDSKYYILAYFLMIFGLICYALLLPVMLYRLIFSLEIADPFKPTIAILAAPASLLLTAYLSLEPQPSLLLCSILLGVALFMTTIIYLAFFKLLRLPFSPAFAAYTFPMAVGATALYKVAERLADYPAAIEYSTQIKKLAILEMVIATIIIAYVCFCFLLYYVQAFAAIKQAKKAARVERRMNLAKDKTENEKLKT